jgi:hypothetical protein
MLSIKNVEISIVSISKENNYRVNTQVNCLFAVDYFSAELCKKIFIQTSI